MSIFNNQKGKLIPIKEKKIDLEKDIQRITEVNIETIFGYKLITSEFKIDTFRFDTLAWDSENKSFIIIEYKKDRNFSIVDQGFSYLSTLLNRKADFILEYNTKYPTKTLKREEIDWSQSRIVFISPFFTPYQVNSINFRNMAFDLFEVKVYDNDTISYNLITPANPQESVDLIVKDNKIEQVTREVKNYTIDYHFHEGWTNSRNLFEILNEKILALDPNFIVSPQKYYIGYKLDNSVVFDIKIYKIYPVIELYRVRPEDLNDPEKRAKYSKNSYQYYNKHVTLFSVKTEDDVDYAMMLIKQVYKKFTS